jgi:dihydrolipoamide dehydrogenase
VVVGELAHERDLVIIGGGPGGYHAAIRAAQLGRKVTLIEKNELGGVCLNEGCIPSKVITNAASRFQLLQDSEEMGVEGSEIRFNFKKLRSYQHNVVNRLKDGVQSLIAANKIERIKGSAYFLSTDRIGVESEDHYEVFRFQHAIIATGSGLDAVSGLVFDGKKIFHSRMLLDIPEIPKHLLIYGHNEIALEMASSFHAFGSEVTILQDTENFGLDSSLEKEVIRLLKKKKIRLLKNTRLSAVEHEADNLQVLLDVKGEKVSLTASHLLVTTTGFPNTKELGLKKIGISLGENGYVTINRQCQTNVPTIYAVGDVTEGPALAVKAISQGKVAAEALCGIKSEFDSFFLPKIIHFQPPIASVGMTEETAISQGYEVRVGQFPLASNGYATLLGKKDGFVKVVTDAKNEVILGIHLIGEGSIELASSGIISLEMAAREEDLKFPFYPHPSINEALLEAVEQLNHQAIHSPPKTKVKI